MSDEFFEATRVVMDGRLGRMFTGPRAKNERPSMRFDQDPRIVEGVITGSRLGRHPNQIASDLNISYSSVMKVRNLFRSRWEGVVREKTTCGH